MPATTPLVLLHPYPTDATFWSRFRNALGSARPIIAPDAPGFGDAEPQDGWSIASAAEAVAELIAMASPGGSADVMGLSMGGYTALALAVRHPERVTALILADTRAGADGPAARQVGATRSRRSGPAAAPSTSPHCCRASSPPGRLPTCATNWPRVRRASRMPR